MENARLYEAVQSERQWLESLLDRLPVPVTLVDPATGEISFKNQEAKDAFYTSHELRWEEAGKPVRQTFSTMWRNHDGLWLIAHQKMSEVKLVTQERVPW